MPEGKSEYPADIMKAVQKAINDCGHFFSNDGELERIVAAAIIDERQRIASELFNRQGFMLCVSDGEHYVKVSFKTIKELHGFHGALVDLSKWKLPAPPSSTEENLQHD